MQLTNLKLRLVLVLLESESVVLFNCVGERLVVLDSLLGLRLLLRMLLLAHSQLLIEFVDDLLKIDVVTLETFIFILKLFVDCFQFGDPMLLQHQDTFELALVAFSTKLGLGCVYFHFSDLFAHLSDFEVRDLH